MHQWCPQHFHVGHWQGGIPLEVCQRGHQQLVKIAGTDIANFESKGSLTKTPIIKGLYKDNYPQSKLPNNAQLLQGHYEEKIKSKCKLKIYRDWLFDTLLQPPLPFPPLQFLNLCSELSHPLLFWVKPQEDNFPLSNCQTMRRCYRGAKERRLHPKIRQRTLKISRDRLFDILL